MKVWSHNGNVSFVSAMLTNSYSAPGTGGKCESWKTVSIGALRQEPPDKSSLIINCSVPDGKVCINAFGELAVTKFAVEPVSRSIWQRDVSLIN